MCIVPVTEEKLQWRYTHQPPPPPPCITANFVMDRYFPLLFNCIKLLFLDKYFIKICRVNMLWGNFLFWRCYGFNECPCEFAAYRVNFHSICHWRHSLGIVTSVITSFGVNIEWTGRDSTCWVVNFHSTGVRIEWNSLLNEWTFFTP